MDWWHLSIPAAAVIFIWVVTRPVRRQVQRGDFLHWFHEVVINSKQGAWLEITDEERKAVLIARKLDATNPELSIVLRTPEDVDAGEVAVSTSEVWESAGLACREEVQEGPGVFLRIDLSADGGIESIAAGAVRFFDAVGSVPGCRFRLRAKGRTDPEALRPLVKAMQRQPKGTRSRAWGKALDKSLDRHRDRE